MDSLSLAERIDDLLPQISGDHDYRGAGAAPGIVSGNVGRFIPHRFVITDNTPRFTNGTSSWGGRSLCGM